MTPYSFKQCVVGVLDGPSVEFCNMLCTLGREPNYKLFWLFELSPLAWGTRNMIELPLFD